MKYSTPSDESVRFKTLILNTIRPIVDEYSNQLFNELTKKIDNTENEDIIRLLANKSIIINNLFSTLHTSINNYHLNTINNINHSYNSFNKIKSTFDKWILTNQSNNENKDFSFTCNPCIKDTNEDDDTTINTWLEENDKMFSIRVFMKEVEHMGYSPLFIVSRILKYKNIYIMITCKYEKDLTKIINNNENLKRKIDDISPEIYNIITPIVNNDISIDTSEIKENKINKICESCNKSRDIKSFTRSGAYKTKEGKKKTIYISKKCSGCYNKEYRERKKNKLLDKPISINYLI